MSDNEWKEWLPRYDGDAPEGATVETHEIESTSAKHLIMWAPHGRLEPSWAVGWKYRYRPRVSTVTSVATEHHYTALRNVLDAAYNQAAHGKGAERHADGKPWTEQPIFTVAGQVGDGFNAGQAIKKIQEAQQMAARGEHTKAMHEVLGAIVYAVSLHVLWEKEAKRDGQ